MRKHIKNFLFFKLFLLSLVLIILILIFGIVYYRPCNTNVRLETLETVGYVSFMTDLNEGLIDTVYFTEQKDELYFLLKDGNYKITSNPKYETFKKDLLESDVIVKPVVDLITAEQVESGRVGHITMLVFIVGCFSIYFCYKSFTTSVSSGGKMIVIKNKKKVTAGSGKDVNFKSEKVASNKDINIKTFDDIAGLVEVKKDMMN